MHPNVTSLQLHLTNMNKIWNERTHYKWWTQITCRNNHGERVRGNLNKGRFKYYVIKEVGGRGQKMAIFDDLQYCKSSKRWVGLKKSRTWWRNTWMVPKANPKVIPHTRKSKDLKIKTNPKNMHQTIWQW